MSIENLKRLDGILEKITSKQPLTVDDWEFIGRAELEQDPDCIQRMADIRNRFLKILIDAGIAEVA